MSSWIKRRPIKWAAPFLAATTALAASGPVEFGLAEFQAVNTTRKWPVKINT